MKKNLNISKAEQVKGVLSKDTWRWAIDQLRLHGFKGEPRDLYKLEDRYRYEDFITLSEEEIIENAKNEGIPRLVTHYLEKRRGGTCLYKNENGKYIYSEFERDEERKLGEYYNLEDAERFVVIHHIRMARLSLNM